MERIGWLKGSARDIALSTDIIVGFPGETEADFEQTLSLLDEVEYDSIFSFKYSVRPNTPALEMGDHMPDEEKGRRLLILQERQRGIQMRKNTALIGTQQEVLVEGFNSKTGQWIGRTTQNRVLNFTAGGQWTKAETIGRYLPVRVTRAGPNSLAGECAITE
jgi:tRNA-2-methylthio-N6-dimethylallyladenosine synthase